MDTSGSTPENRVPTVMAQPVVNQVYHERAETSVSVSEREQREHLQSMRNMRDQIRTVATDLSSVRVRMAAEAEHSRVECQNSQDSFEADR